MKKIKITFFLPNLKAGGAERVILNLISGLNKEGFQITLLLREFKGEFKNHICKDVFISELKTSNIFFVFFKIINYFRKNSPDIFISSFAYSNIISILARYFSFSKTKIIIIEHTPFSQAALEKKNVFRRVIDFLTLVFLRKLTYPNAEAIICVSRGIAKEINNIKGIAKNKIRVIYNGIVSDEIYKQSKEPIEEKCFHEPKLPIILAVGRLIIAKDYPTLLKAFALIRQERPAYLVILGEGEEQINLEELAEKLQISKDVVFLGFKENPYKYMANALVYVLSSKREGFASVLAEAMTCGVPIVSTDCKSGPNEIIKNGENGILVPVGDIKALARAIIKILDDVLLRDRFIKEGKKRARDFSVERAARKYEQLLYEISNG